MCWFSVKPRCYCRARQVRPMPGWSNQPNCRARLPVHPVRAGADSFLWRSRLQQVPCRHFHFQRWLQILHGEPGRQAGTLPPPGRHLSRDLCRAGPCAALALQSCCPLMHTELLQLLMSFVS